MTWDKINYCENVDFHRRLWGQKIYEVHSSIPLHQPNIWVEDKWACLIAYHFFPPIAPRKFLGKTAQDLSSHCRTVKGGGYSLFLGAGSGRDSLSLVPTRLILSNTLIDLYTYFLARILGKIVLCASPGLNGSCRSIIWENINFYFPFQVGFNFCSLSGGYDALALDIIPMWIVSLRCKRGNWRAPWPCICIKISCIVMFW